MWLCQSMWREHSFDPCLHSCSAQLRHFLVPLSSSEYLLIPIVYFKNVLSIRHAWMSGWRRRWELYFKLSKNIIRSLECNNQLPWIVYTIKYLSSIALYCYSVIHDSLTSSRVVNNFRNFKINIQLQYLDTYYRFFSFIYLILIPTALLWASSSSTLANCITAPPTFLNPCAVRCELVMCLIYDPRLTPEYCLAYP